MAHDVGEHLSWDCFNGLASNLVVVKLGFIYWDLFIWDLFILYGPITLECCKTWPIIYVER